MSQLTLINLRAAIQTSPSVEPTLRYQDETLSTYDEIISQRTHYKLIDLIRGFS